MGTYLSNFITYFVKKKKMQFKTEKKTFVYLCFCIIFDISSFVANYLHRTVCTISLLICLS